MIPKIVATTRRLKFRIRDRRGAVAKHTRTVEF